MQQAKTSAVGTNLKRNSSDFNQFYMVQRMMSNCKCVKWNKVSCYNENGKNQASWLAVSLPVAPVLFSRTKYLKIQTTLKEKKNQHLVWDYISRTCYTVVVLTAVTCNPKVFWSANQESGSCNSPHCLSAAALEDSVISNDFFFLQMDFAGYHVIANIQICVILDSLCLSM